MWHSSNRTLLILSAAPAFLLFSFMARAEPLPDSPGTHVARLQLSKWMSLLRTSGNNGTRRPDTRHPDNIVGFSQMERGGTGEPFDTAAWQMPLTFSTMVLDRINNKRIDRAVLLLDEVESPTCALVANGIQRHCWQNGEGRHEHKPKGCVLVRVPSVDWTRSSVKGEVPTLAGGPTHERMAPGQYDVTASFRAQHGDATPPGPSTGFHFVLVGPVDFGNLRGRDMTTCISQVSNVRMAVTYTVLPPDSGHRLRQSAP